jgi:dethiobiotin synthetase
VSEIIFVTGTDTGVGKTIATAALAAQYVAQKQRVSVVKPFQTGVSAEEPGDLDVVTRFVPVVSTIELSRYSAPLAPATAARVSGRDPVDIYQVRDAILEASKSADITLVEGAGGVMVEVVPAATLMDVADLVAEQGATVHWVIVARAGLGTLNHSALTAWALSQRRHRVTGLIIGSWPQHPDLATRCNLDDLPAVTGAPYLGRIPAGASALPPDEFRTWAPRWLSLPRR